MSKSSSLRIRGRIDVATGARAAHGEAPSGPTPVLRDAANRSFYIEGERGAAELMALVGQEVEVLGTLRTTTGSAPRLHVEAILTTGRRRPLYPSGRGWR